MSDSPRHMMCFSGMKKEIGHNSCSKESKKSIESENFNSKENYKPNDRTKEPSFFHGEEERK
ncbi:MAG: hypothetical protein ACH0QD_13335 [Tepidibacillus sp.]